MVFAIEDQMPLHHEVRRRGAERGLDQVQVAVAEQMDADPERQIEHPTAVREHRTRPPSEARTEIRKKGRPSAPHGEFVQLRPHLRGRERWPAGGLGLGNGLEDQPQALVELRPVIHFARVSVSRGRPRRRYFSARIEKPRSLKHSSERLPWSVVSSTLSRPHRR